METVRAEGIRDLKADGVGWYSDLLRKSLCIVGSLVAYRGRRHKLERRKKMSTDNITVVIVTIAIAVVVSMIGYASYKNSETNADDSKATFHSACLKAGYSVDECNFEWIKEGR